MNKAITVAVALTLGVALDCAAQAESLDELYAKAKTEGALHIYAGGPALIDGKTPMAPLRLIMSA